MRRWIGVPIKKRHVPEPDRLRQLAASLKGKADALMRRADALIAEAQALEDEQAAKPKHSN